MNLYEKIYIRLREYGYNRSRNKGKSNNFLDLEEYIEEMDIYIGKIIEELECLVTK